MIQSVKGSAQSNEDTRIEAQKKRLYRACQDFESIMNTYMLKSLRQSVMKAEESEPGLELVEGMLDETLSAEMSKNGDKALSGMLYQQLVPLVQAQAGSRNRT